MSKTKIEWTEASWNPIVGCSVITPGCTNCYAMAMAARIDKMTLASHYEGLTKKVNGKQVWTGKLALANDHVFTAPLRRRKPTTYFVNSMGDLFHEDCPDEWIDKVFAVMALCPQHTFQVLTKRAERMREYFAGAHLFARLHVAAHALADWDHPAQKVTAMMFIGHLKHGTGNLWPLPNVWLGVSTERQKEADERIPLLLQTPAAVRFISAEPLLGPIDLTKIALPEATATTRFLDALRGQYWTDLPRRISDTEGKLDWVIVGGESGHGARPMHPDWARTLRDQCAATGVAFFFKQWGDWKNGSDFASDAMCVTTDGRVIKPTPDAMTLADTVAPLMRLDPTMMRRVGKKAAGRLLDGITHDAMPARRAGWE